MDEVTFHREPPSHLPTLVMALGGWIDAGEAATGAMRALVRQLKAEPLAEIDPEDFVDFTQVRPVVRLTAEGERTIRWPRIVLWTWQPPAGGATPLSWRRAPAAVAHLRDPAPGRGHALWGATGRVAGRGARGRAAYPAHAHHGQQPRSRVAGTVRGVRDADPSLALRRPDRDCHYRHGRSAAPRHGVVHRTGTSAPLSAADHESGSEPGAAQRGQSPTRPGARSLPF
jgi:PAC2 family protein